MKHPPPGTMADARVLIKEGTFEGENFLVFGNGPSIDTYPKEIYEEWPGITMGINRITKLFWPNIYFALHNFTQFMAPRPNIPQGTITISWKGGDRDRAQYHADLMAKRYVWNEKRDGFVSAGNTTAIAALSLAYQLGAKAIFLIGFDFLRDPNTDNLYFGGMDRRGTKNKGWYANSEDGNAGRNLALDTIESGCRHLFSIGIPVLDLSEFGKLRGPEKARFISSGKLET